MQESILIAEVAQPVELPPDTADDRAGSDLAGLFVALAFFAFVIPYVVLMFRRLDKIQDGK